MKRLLVTLLLFVVAILMLRRLGGTLGGARRREVRGSRTRARRGGAREATRLVRDPLCLTYVPADTALPAAGESGETIWFCSDRCRASWRSGQRAAS